MIATRYTLACLRIQAPIHITSCIYSGAMIHSCQVCFTSWSENISVDYEIKCNLRKTCTSVFLEDVENCTSSKDECRFCQTAQETIPLPNVNINGNVGDKNKHAIRRLFLHRSLSLFPFKILFTTGWCVYR